ncbi:hypothetical protein [Marinovum algicola]|uniref:hypothetical protein n=1 Tax=Marinovum algicola TaxID=42444 RepID=UPI003B51A459
MTPPYPPEQLMLTLEPSVTDDLTPEQRGQTVEALALLLLTAIGGAMEEMPDET